MGSVKIKKNKCTKEAYGMKKMFYPNFWSVPELNPSLNEQDSSHLSEKILVLI